ncbi:nitronate monooxygenase family protein [Oceanicola sp. 502str15]|uniref:NAD(P)H-dependent flavin oxidoreductase n=1 Tax=Oceanicola sp. 502str15 TaxID=2696061 RepID=UPI00209491E0|nr:nitronate monooxygenase family protein [Oceanicola sp. 502str15]MCO6383037.1 nitronate monooxygenase [Oceanicola sp. 502str15]
MNDSTPQKQSARAAVEALRAGLRLPVVAAPMFLVSNTALTTALCASGVVGSFPALNARPQEELSTWLAEIEAARDAARAEGRPFAPHAVNIILRKTNARMEADIQTCIAHEVPILITSMSAPDEVTPRIHAYGGLVFHDVTTVRHAKRAIRAGVDGLILVCAGAGGHGGLLNPFAFLSEVRGFWDGPVILAGALTTGAQVLAAELLGADLCYIGTRFIATAESAAVDPYKQMLTEADAGDIIYTPYFSGTPANYLGPSITRAGLDLDEIRQPAEGTTGTPGERHLRWKDIWGAGQGVGQITDAPPAAALVDRMVEEYETARAAWRARMDQGR